MHLTGITENNYIVNSLKFYGQGKNKQLTSRKPESKLESNQPYSSLSKKVVSEWVKVALQVRILIILMKNIC